jgi:hypothetical protein
MLSTQCVASLSPLSNAALQYYLDPGSTLANIPGLCRVYAPGSFFLDPVMTCMFALSHFVSKFALYYTQIHFPSNPASLSMSDIPWTSLAVLHARSVGAAACS